jgi:signal transduction histidine kinase
MGLHIAEIPVGGESREFLATIHDATESKRAEARLRRGQKMEAVGQLTGGVAHEFNNLLAVILSDLEALNDGDLSDDEYNECLSSALGATRKGADLIHRLLTFSKRQTLRPGPVVVNDLVGNLAKLIGRNFGKTIEIDFKPGKDTGEVYVDAGQLENAIVNLAVNARDAMPTGGRISISTALVDWDPKYDRTLSDLPSGVYVQISICDTGAGMPSDIVARAIEPFFTTKEFGRGSGLGLSIAYGFASQSGGTVDIRSAVGRGTTVAILLPKEPVAQHLLPFSTLAELEM